MVGCVVQLISWRALYISREGEAASSHRWWCGDAMISCVWHHHMGAVSPWWPACWQVGLDPQNMGFSCPRWEHDSPTEIAEAWEWGYREHAALCVLYGITSCKTQKWYWVALGTTGISMVKCHSACNTEFFKKISHHHMGGLATLEPEEDGIWGNQQACDVIESTHQSCSPGEL